MRQNRFSNTTGVITAIFSAAVVWAALVCLPAAATAQMAPVTEDQLREFVKQVIRENPKLLYDTINDYLREQQQEKQEQAMEEALENRVETRVADHNPARGPEDAKITIIEYTDFQCPYCSRGDKIVHNLLRKYRGKVRRVYKNKPLESHEEALPAAKAAMAAHIQGKFWEYHDQLFKYSRDLDDEMYVRFAEELGLDVDKFNKDRASDKVAKWIEADLAAAEKLDITGTPAFILNGALISGVRPMTFFSEMIDRLLKE
jgi:protein-disulfide isomerase